MSTAYFRRLSPAAFVRYTPATRAFDVVPAARAPRLVPLPLELSATPGRLMRQRKATLARLLALAMVRKQLEATEAGTPDAAAGSIAALAQLAGDPAQVARIVGMRGLDGATAGPVEMSWVEYKGPKGGTGWKNTETGRVVYQRDMPGRHAERKQKQAASEESGLALAKKVHAGTATAEDLGELVTHLPAMRAVRLRNVAAILDKRLGGVRRRDAMVNALLGHVATMTAADGTRADGSKADAPAKSEPKPGEVRTVPTRSLKVDPARFQFKLGTNASGVTKELQGVRTFNPEFAGVVSTWVDPADGQEYVVNGHHRHELAERTGHPELAVRRIQAKDAREARAKGALINIAEGRGTALDAAKFMRDMGVSPEDLAKHGVSLNGKLAADAATLTRLNDAAFDRLARGGLDPEKALAVARHLTDPARQERLFGLLAKREEEGKDLSRGTVEEMARQMAAAPGVSKTESTLWGDETTDEDTFVERAELAAHVRAALAQEHSDFGAVSSARRAGKVAGAGNTLNVDENKRRAADAEEAKALYDGLAHKRGPVADALDAGAVKLKTAKTKKERTRAKTEALEAVRAAVRGQLDALHKRPADGAGEGGVDRGGGAGGGSEPPTGAAPAPDAGRGGGEPAGVMPAGDPSAAHATAAHEAAIAAIPAGDSRFVAGHRVRHTPAGAFQVERRGGFLTGTKEQVADHIRSAWKNQVGYDSLPGALARASAYAEPDPFAEPERAAADARGRAAVPDGTRAVSLDDNTRGRVGAVRRDPDSGAARLQLDGGVETRATDFEPLDPAHSWRAAPAERATRRPKGGATADLFDAAGPTPSAAPAGAVPSGAMNTPVPVPPPPPPPPAEPPRAPTDRGSLDSIKEATDRALGVKRPTLPTAPKKGEYAAWLRAAAADPARMADVQTLAPSPLLDRNELLAAVNEVYGPAVHAEAKRKSKQGIAELLRAAKPG